MYNLAIKATVPEQTIKCLTSDFRLVETGNSPFRVMKPFGTLNLKFAAICNFKLMLTHTHIFLKAGLIQNMCDGWCCITVAGAKPFTNYKCKMGSDGE